MDDVVVTVVAVVADEVLVAVVMVELVGVVVDVSVVEEAVWEVDVIVVIGSTVVVVSTTAGQPEPWKASSGHSV